MAVNPTLGHVSFAPTRRPNTSTHVPPAGIVASVRAVLGGWHRRVETRRQLSRLDERALLDIGFDPEDARAEAAKPFWQAYTLARSAER
jgi:uncharacterized protein YjiS (DUF1127 family)